MFDCRGGVLLTPPGWNDPDPPDLGDWEPIPDEVWRELDAAIPFWADEGDIPFADKPIDEALKAPLGAHTWRLLNEPAVSDLSDVAKAWALKRTGELISRIEGLRAELIAALAGPKPTDPREDWAAHDVSVAANCSLPAAQRKVTYARTLAGRLSATRDALLAGRITERQATALAEETAHLSDEVALKVQARMLKYCHRQDFPKFKAALKRWLSRLDPDFVKRAVNARREITVEHLDNEDGTGGLYLRGPLEKTALIDTALRAYATATKQAKGGTAEERKLDALVEWAEAYLTAPEAPRRHGRAYTIQLVIDAPTMFGLANHPAEIPGYGMVPADAALDLLADGAPIRRLLIDEHDGHLLHYGTKTYLVPPSLADHLIALHHRSVGPHSGVPAASCDMEHNLPHQDGGTTDPDNNAPVDRRWHRAKTHTGWTYVINKDHSVTWTSPYGMTETVHPHDYRLGP
ncbi:MAG TPA: DUF222 domain-containing protein [Mycobacteriales bacterium]|nr:DUF222 domain-containing protein [Mycobacteriales bacterium]